MSSLDGKPGAWRAGTSRRAFLNAIPVAAAAIYAPVATASINNDDAPAPEPQQGHGEAIPNMMGSEQIAMLVYPGFTALDLVGPHFFLSGLMGAKVHLVTNQSDLTPVVGDAGLAVTPTARLQDMTGPLDVVFVPGGFQGTLVAMTHQPTLDFLKQASAQARVVTSVCTGSFILAAAGLLAGRRATSHWAARDSLSAFGVHPVDERVVVDGKFITGAGISAGLDAGLAVVEALRGRPYAQAQMLQAEYAPVPPFKGGRPETTPPAITAAMQQMLGGFNARARAIAG